VRLGPVLDASTVSEPPRFIPVRARFQLASGGGVAEAATPIEPQEQLVRATVTLVFALEPGPGR
jgi:uncharacterized protein